jgi:hypothetical protein
LLFHFQLLENADVDQKKGGRAKEGMKQKRLGTAQALNSWNTFLEEFGCWLLPD